MPAGNYSSTAVRETVDELKCLGKDALLGWLTLLEKEAENLAIEGLLLLQALSELGYDIGVEVDEMPKTTRVRSMHRRRRR